MHTYTAAGHGNLALASTVVPHLARRDRSGHVGILLLSLSSSGGAVGLGQPSVSVRQCVVQSVGY